MSGWQKGRADIEQLLETGDLDRVQPSGDLAHHLLDDAAAHIDTAHAAIDDDPTGALQIGCDAARKAAIALLPAQGLRGTTEGGHRAIAAAAAAQFDGTFDRLECMRRRRNAAEYPDIDTPEVTEGDARDASRSVSNRARSTDPTARSTPTALPPSTGTVATSTAS